MGILIDGDIIEIGDKGSNVATHVTKLCHNLLVVYDDQNNEQHSAEEITCVVALAWGVVDSVIMLYRSCYLTAAELTCIVESSLCCAMWLANMNAVYI